MSGGLNAFIAKGLSNIPWILEKHGKTVYIELSGTRGGAIQESLIIQRSFGAKESDLRFCRLHGGLSCLGRGQLGHGTSIIRHP